MPREIQEQHTIWSLSQAYAGLEELKSARKDASEKDGLVWVTATPSGGAQSVRLHLPTDWESEMNDEELLQQIADKA